MRSEKVWPGANGSYRENLVGGDQLCGSLPIFLNQLHPQATSTGQTKVSMSSRLPGSMALSVTWSFPRV